MTENSQWALIWLPLLAMLSLWVGLWLHWAELGKRRIPCTLPPACAGVGERGGIAGLALARRNL